MNRFIKNDIPHKVIERPNVRMLLALAVFVVFSCLQEGAVAAPDLSGPWEIQSPVNTLLTEEGNAPPLTAEGQKLYMQNQAKLNEDPLLDCLPPGIPRALMQKGYPFSIVLGKTLGGMFIEWNHLPRPIYMNQQHFENIGPTYLGQSVGYWDGDTLVIDTNGFNDLTWLDASGLPHSDQLQVVERIRLVDDNTLEAEFTLSDPVVFKKAWTTQVLFDKRPGYIVKEDYCLGRTGQGVTESITTKSN